MSRLRKTAGHASPPSEGGDRQKDLFAMIGGETVSEATVRNPIHPCTLCAETYLSDRDVAARYRVSRATIWRWVESSLAFPKPKKLSAGTTRWRLGDLVSFEAKAPDARTNQSDNGPAADIR